MMRKSGASRARVSGVAVAEEPVEGLIGFTIR
jgi:hypothetical protein